MTIQSPVSERSACVFHLVLAVVGAVHLIGGLAMIWFHAVAAKRHAEAAGIGRVHT